LNGLEEKCIELLIDGVLERKKYKIKDENMIKAIGNILKKLSENEGAKRIIQVIHYIDFSNMFLESRFKIISRKCRNS